MFQIVTIAAFLLMGLPAAALPIRLDYTFLGSNHTASQGLNAIFHEHVDGSQVATSSSFGASDTYRIDLSLEISSDRRTVSILSYEYQDDAVGLSVADQFELGFSGNVPYTAELESFHYSLGGFDCSIAVAGDFNCGFQPASATLGGNSQLLGSDLSFSVSDTTSARIMGTFFPEPDLSEVGLEIIVTARAPEGVINAASFSGLDLELFADGDPNSPSFGRESAIPTFVPEPGTATLLGAGLAALAAARGSRPRPRDLRKAARFQEVRRSRSTRFHIN